MIMQVYENNYNCLVDCVGFILNNIFTGYDKQRNIEAAVSHNRRSARYNIFWSAKHETQQVNLIVRISVTHRRVKEGQGRRLI